MQLINILAINPFLSFHAGKKDTAKKKPRKRKTKTEKKAESNKKIARIEAGKQAVEIFSEWMQKTQEIK